MLNLHLHAHRIHGIYQTFVNMENKVVNRYNMVTASSISTQLNWLRQWQGFKGVIPKCAGLDSQFGALFGGDFRILLRKRQADYPLQ